MGAAQDLHQQCYCKSTIAERQLLSPSVNQTGRAAVSEELAQHGQGEVNPDVRIIRFDKCFADVSRSGAEIQHPRR